MIRETIVTTVNAHGQVHIAPMGVREVDGCVILAPFRPSTTLENVLATGYATINLSDDVRVFAGCLTDRRNWRPASAWMVRSHIASCNSHVWRKIRSGRGFL
jgi:hypothetical protein